MAEFKKFDGEKKIDWMKGHTFAKMYLKSGDKGKFFVGDLNKKNVLILSKATGQYAKEGEWVLKICEIEYVMGAKTEAAPAAVKEDDGF